MLSAASGSPKLGLSSQPTTPDLFNIVRRVNTRTIETVDASGIVQQWTRSEQ
jgi:hypothetical protein